MRSIDELLSSLVEINSVTPREQTPTPERPGEAHLIAFLQHRLAERGISVTTSEVLPGRPNLYALVEGRSRDLLILETHADTVEVEGMVSPFTPRISNGRLYGRGSADAKASISAFLLALEDAACRPVPPPVSVLLAIVADEEHAYRGVLQLLADLPAKYRVCGAVIGEPTGLQLGVAHRGCLRFTVEIHGTSGHSSMPEDAISAVDNAFPVMQLLKTYAKQTSRPSLAGDSCLSVTRIHSGEGPNIIPGYLEFDVDWRTTPGTEPNQLFTQVRAMLAETFGSRVRLRAPFTTDVALDTSVTSALVTNLRSAIADIDLNSDPVGLPFGSDASKIARAGHPAVVFGPGSIDDAHTVDESVSLAEVVAAREVITDLIQRFEA